MTILYIVIIIMDIITIITMVDSHHYIITNSCKGKNVSKYRVLSCLAVLFGSCSGIAVYGSLISVFMDSTIVLAGCIHALIALLLCKNANKKLKTYIYNPSKATSGEEAAVAKSSINTVTNYVSDVNLKPIATFDSGVVKLIMSRSATSSPIGYYKMENGVLNVYNINRELIGRVRDNDGIAWMEMSREYKYDQYLRIYKEQGIDLSKIHKPWNLTEKLGETWGHGRGGIYEQVGSEDICTAYYTYDIEKSSSMEVGAAYMVLANDDLIPSKRSAFYKMSPSELWR